MRFALIATSAAALVAVPLAMGASGPQMSSEQFLAAVRCTAYESVTRPSAELAPVRMQLNSEARHQPAETAARAKSEARAIALQAVISDSSADQAMVGAELTETCAPAELAEGSSVADAA